VTELVVCPLCAEIVHRHYRTQVETRISVPSRFEKTTDVFAAMHQMALDERAEEMAVAERDCVSHYEKSHQLRLWLWRRLGWSHLITWPTRAYTHTMPEDQLFEPLKFMKQKT
jgi:hypothetical protein